MLELAESDTSPVLILVQTSLVKTETTPLPSIQVHRCAIAGITAGWCLVSDTAVVTKAPAVDDKKGWRFC